MPSIAVPVPTTRADERLMETVGNLVRAHVRLVKEKSRILGLSAPQLFLLRGLDELGEIPVSRWAEEFGASPSATTALVDGLVEAGYIVRHDNELDRRQVLVTLTAKGRRLTEGAKKESRRWWGELCKGIPEADLRKAAEVLAKIVAGLETQELRTDWLEAGMKVSKGAR